MKEGRSLSKINNNCTCGILWLGWYYFLNNTRCQFPPRFLMINKYTGIAVLVSMTGVVQVLLCCNMKGACGGAYSVVVLLPQVPPGCGC